MSNLNEHLILLSRWIDGSYPTDLDPELHIRRRVDKIAEEFGEVTEALGGVVGENPRKGVTHTWDDVDRELLDVATAALGAFVSRNDNAPDLDVTAMLADHIEAVTIRAGLKTCPAPVPHGEHERGWIVDGFSYVRTCLGRRTMWEGP